ncbi:O-antigen ligase domain-containing protein [Clostridiaceae bacterium]|nr:O-antigen ligase domain-containing protein [Clostridiaceae bacterium]
MLYINHSNKKSYYLNYIYICFFILYCGLYSLVPLTPFMGNPIWKILNYGLGISVLVFDCLSVKCFLKIYYYPLIFLFIISYLLTILINYKYGIFRNLQEVYYMCIFFIVTLSLGGQSDKGKLRKQYIVFNLLINIVWILGIIWSIKMFFVGYDATLSIDNRTVIQGFHESRLWGVFSDPNYASLSTLAIMWSTISLYSVVQKKITKIIMYISIILQFIHIILSNSRTTKITFFFTLTVYLICKYKRKYGYQKIGLKTLSHVCLTIIGIAVLWNIFSITLIATSNSVQTIRHNRNHNVVATSYPSSDSSDTYVPQPQTLERTDVQTTNISNNRFNIWKSALEIYGNHPLWGTGFGYMTEVAKSTNPDTYIVLSSYSIHNGYLDILISSGISGFIIMITFFIFTFISIINSLFKIHVSERLRYVSLFLAPLSIAIGHLMLSGLCYSSTFTSFLFWLYLGFSLKVSLKFI